MKNLLKNSILSILCLTVFYFSPAILAQNAITISVLDSENGYATKVDKVFTNQASADKFLAENNYEALELDSEVKLKTATVTQEAFGEFGLLETSTAQVYVANTIYYPADANVSYINGYATINWKNPEEEENFTTVVIPNAK